MAAEGVAGVLTNPMTAQDDLIIGGASGTPNRLAEGGADQMLIVNPSSGRVAWGAGTFVNVLHYGATGNGTTDDTAAINAAIAAVPSGGGTVFFPRGTYKITSLITIASPKVSLLGEGNEFAGTIIQQATSSTGALHFSTVSGPPQPTIRGIRVVGPNDTAAAGSHGIYALSGCNLEDIGVTGFSDGIYLDGNAYYSHIDSSDLSGNSRYQVACFGTNNTTISRCRINYDLVACQYGVYMVGVLGCRILQCAIEGFSTAGVVIDGNSTTNPQTEVCLISGCYFEQNGSQGDIVLGPTAGTNTVHIASNIFVGSSSAAGAWCIQGNLCGRVTIANNSIAVISSGSNVMGGVYGGANASTYLLLNNDIAASATVTLPARSYRLDPEAPPYTTVAHNGTTVTDRSILNLIDGSNITLTVADNSGAGRTDVTIAAAANATHVYAPLTNASPSSPQLIFNSAGGVVMAETTQVAS